LPCLNVNGVEIELDEDGFMIDPDLWNEDVARAFAASEGINELNEDHWKVINYLCGIISSNTILHPWFGNCARKQVVV